MHGRFFAAATRASGPGQVLVWNAAGEFQRAFGGIGQGPGELLGRGLPALLLGPGDSLFVIEGTRWTVFDTTQGFARVMQPVAAHRRYGAVHLTDEGLILSSGPVIGGHPRRWFHLSDRNGRLIRSFGEVSVPIRGRALPVRPTSYNGGDMFWAAPPPGAPDGYILEQWSIEGRLVRQLRLDARWMDGDDLGAGELPFFVLHVDGEGLLWVLAFVEDSRWTERASDPDDPERYDLRYEVIDPETVEVLASGLIDEAPDEAERNWPPIARFLQGTRVSYRPVPDSLGLRKLEFFELHLVRAR